MLNIYITLQTEKKYWVKLPSRTLIYMKIFSDTEKALWALLFDIIAGSAEIVRNEGNDTCSHRLIWIEMIKTVA